MADTDFTKLGVFIDVCRRAVGVANLSVAILTRDKIISSLQRGSRYTSSPVGTPPNNRRNSLRNSFGTRVNGDMVAQVTSNSRYSLIHETGGTIRAVNVQYLRIPLNMSAAAFAEDIGMNSLRQYPFQWRPTKKKSPDIGGILVMKSKYEAKMYKTINKTLKSGARRKAVRAYITESNTLPRFLLKKSVYLPPRPYIRPAWEAVKADPQTLVVWGAAASNYLQRYTNFRLKGRFK
jgi:hypothetical protein